MRLASFGNHGLLALALLATSGVAQAHTSGLPHLDFTAGLDHPIGGLDHVLAMVAVGLWAAQVGGRALWLAPLTFVLTMAAGGALGFLGIQLPLVELGIAGSVLILGVLIMLASRLPPAASMALVGAFAVFHGHAHGAEMAAEASALWYSLGFMLATALLHGAGIGIGLLARRGAAAQWLRLSGGAIAVAGAALLVG
ncbi:MAG TPA: HupE/UreJ family protein [Candidatus Competibacter sp.]|nr:urease accessory protein [Candidatus Competibacteraceae bacterium]HRE53477.1 HupE/UreJ family protein [Candidatus Competibacter sp.]HUM94029.1 HupE/UreJ family protein [Candidatus Competibacter sp.]